MRCHGCGKTIPEDYTMAFTLGDGTKEPLGYHLWCYPSSTRPRTFLTIHNRSLIGRVFQWLHSALNPERRHRQD